MNTIGDFLATIVGIILKIACASFLLCINADEIHEVVPAYPDMNFFQASCICMTLYGVGSLFRKVEL